MNDSRFPGAPFYTLPSGGGGGADLAIKAPCRCGTTVAGGNLVLVGGVPAAIDTVVLALNDRVLVKNQTLPAENGIYVCSVPGAGGTLVRATDFDNGAEVTGTTLVGVQEGTPFAAGGNEDTFWFVTTDGVIVIGVTPIVWAPWIGGVLPYVPAVPSDWAPPPALVATALDQIVRNGAGHFQKARDPLLTPAPTIYVRTTGNDSNANDGTLALPFASIARALQSLPAMPEYGGTFPVIDVGAGTFPLPLKIDVGADIVISPAPMTVAVAYLIDVTQPVNTKATSTRLVLDTQALAATVPVGTRVRLTATTTPSGPIYGIVCRSDNSGVVASGPAGLVLWVSTDNFTAPYVCNVADGTSIEILAFATTFECQDYTTIRGGYVYNTVDFTGAAFTTAGGGSSAFVIFDGGEADYSNFSVMPFVASGGLLSILPYLVERLRTYQSAPVEILGGVSSAASFFVRNYGGDARCVGEMASIGTGIMFGCSDGGSLEADGTVLRAFAGTGQFLSANDPSGTGGDAGLGGSFVLGDCLEPRNLAGAVIAGSFTGTFLVNVGAETAVRVKLGAASGIVVGLVTNPVAINGVARSADVSGTRIAGGYPAPGPAGPAYRGPIAADTAWSATTDNVLEMDSQAASRDVDLPAAASVNPGCTAVIKKGYAANDVTVTPAGADTIDHAAGVLSYVAVYGAGNQGSINFVSDGVSNWSRT
jgi:hypothetical protein